MFKDRSPLYLREVIEGGILFSCATTMIRCFRLARVFLITYASLCILFGFVRRYCHVTLVYFFGTFWIFKAPLRCIIQAMLLIFYIPLAMSNAPFLLFFRAFVDRIATGFAPAVQAIRL